MGSKLWLQQHMVLFMIIAFAPCVMLFGTLCCCQNVMKTFPVNYVFLFVYTVLESITVGICSSFYTTSSVGLVVVVTAGVTLGLSLYAMFTKHDFTGCYPFMWSILIAFMCFGGVVVLAQSLNFGPLPSGIQMGFAAIGVLIYSVYIVHGTPMLSLNGASHRPFGVDEYCWA